MNPTLPQLDDSDAMPFVVLASASPRRQSMFKQAGVRHAVLPASVDDGELHPAKNLNPAEWVAALAYLKAASSAQLFVQEPIEANRLNTVVIGADTVCVHDGKILGQPGDRAEAHAMIVAMSDAEHEVLTGIAIVDPVTGRREIFIDRSRVRVGSIPEHEIIAYLDSEQWRGKAGAYNITERLAAGWPISFEGDETSIVGIPMTRTLERVSRFFVD
ncbi:MAG: Maf family protein [Phycisphaerales bacterium]|nr:Maf family protein [Phycisphaerales bacterium]